MSNEDEEVKNDGLDISSAEENSEMVETETTVEQSEKTEGDVSELLEEDANGEFDADEGDDGETISESRTEEVTEAQQKQYEKLGHVKEKISKILNASNIEIVDENIGDEYELDDDADAKKQQEQDYDSLKALFGDADKNRKNELTLTIDDFDYTYAGQYVDEFDLLHVKNIKHIKLQRKHSKHFKKIIVAAVIILAAGLGGLLSYLLLRQKPVVLQSVALNQTSNTCYINEKFKTTGLYFIATYSDGSMKKVPLNYSNLVDIVGNVDRSNNEIKFIGGQRAELTFSYEGINVVYSIEIKHKNLEDIQVFYSDGLFNLDAEENKYITQDYLKILCDYGDYGIEKLNFSEPITITVDGTKLNYESNIGGFRLVNNITKDSEIVVSYGGKEITFGYEENAGIIK